MIESLCHQTNYKPHSKYSHINTLENFLFDSRLVFQNCFRIEYLYFANNATTTVKALKTCRSAVSGKMKVKC